jgi:hypothetical protein
MSEQNEKAQTWMTNACGTRPAFFVDQHHDRCGKPVPEPVWTNAAAGAAIAR